MLLAVHTLALSLQLPSRPAGAASRRAVLDAAAAVLLVGAAPVLPAYAAPADDVRAASAALKAERLGA